MKFVFEINRTRKETETRICFQISIPDFWQNQCDSHSSYLKQKEILVFLKIYSGQISFCFNNFSKKEQRMN